MTDQKVFGDLVKGWQGYQGQLVAVVKPMTDEQLALGAGSGLRTVGQLAAHIVATRAGWLGGVLGEDPVEFRSMHEWDIDGTPARSGAELADALELTWQVIRDGLTRWTNADYDEVLTRQREGQTYTFVRGWVIWHLLEHDLHHGGELGFSLGLHGLPALDLD